MTSSHAWRAKQQPGSILQRSSGRVSRQTPAGTQDETVQQHTGVGWQPCGVLQLAFTRIH